MILAAAYPSTPPFATPAALVNGTRRRTSGGVFGPIAARTNVVVGGSS